METEKIYNLIILDESGSMESIKKSTINGLNEVIQTVKELEKKFPEQEYFISFVTFNGQDVRTHLDKAAAGKMKEIDETSYRPNGSTPLYDAIGLSLVKLKYDLVENKNAHVLVTILTDGEENASREFNGSQVKRMIEEQKQQGWTFTYIGANHDVEGFAMSISISNTMTFTAHEEGVKEMFSREKNARHNYSSKLKDKQDLSADFYKEEPLQH